MIGGSRLTLVRVLVEYIIEKLSLNNNNNNNNNNQISSKKNQVIKIKELI